MPQCTTVVAAYEKRKEADRMETLDAQILSLTDQAATAALELALYRAGLTPDPFATDHPHDQLRAALHHTDLLSPGDITAQPPSDGDIARVTLLYLAERDASCRTAITHLLAHSTEPGTAVTRDPGSFLLALHTDLELRKRPDQGWYFHVKVKPLPASTLSKLLSMLYAKFVG
jgi:hypothetical protein